MKQVTVTFHFDNDDEANEMHESLKWVRRWQKVRHIVEDNPLNCAGAKIVQLEIKGPND